ncbi:unnamed protein product [Rotaria sordida]|uniref:Uncharacterized protein n=1 Tax=Rotaria sordida TaxID=392033 RepID=A0A815BU46_9BILA|nr:unnamed protein product [Rotaria sordida]CAF3822416.1 unnamed protein product [Rotaria sordida]
MGINACCGQRPPEKFVGQWSNGNEVQMTISEDGHIFYRKQKPNGNSEFKGNGRFDENGFWSCAYGCFFLNGVYEDQRRQQSILTVKGDVLTKQPVSVS